VHKTDSFRVEPARAIARQSDDPIDEIEETEE